MLCPSCKNNVIPNDSHCPVCNFNFSTAPDFTESPIDCEQSQSHPEYHGNATGQAYDNYPPKYHGDNYSQYRRQPFQSPQYFTGNNGMVSTAPIKNKMHTEDPGFAYALLSFVFGFLSMILFVSGLSAFANFALGIVGIVMSICYFKNGNKICSKFNIAGFILSLLAIVGTIMIGILFVFLTILRYM